MATLQPGERIAARFHEGGGGPVRAIALTRQQLSGLRAVVEDDGGWERLKTLVARAGDPWNADDWPLGFDPLVVCAPLCQDVRFECVKCPVGRAQAGTSCAHPQSLFGFIGTLVASDDRAGLRRHLDAAEVVLGGGGDWDVPRVTLILRS